MNYTDKRIKIIDKAYEDNYLNKLAIMEHLRECNFLWDNDYKKTKDIKNLNKELADLYILLDIWFRKYDNYQNVPDRIDRFIEKISKDKKIWIDEDYEESGEVYIEKSNK